MSLRDVVEDIADEIEELIAMWSTGVVRIPGPDPRSLTP